MKKFLFVLFIILFVINTAYSDSLKIGYTLWKPYTFVENGEVKGLSVEIYSEALQRAGLNFEFIQYPWARAVSNFENGDLDCLADGTARFENSFTVEKLPIPWVQVFWVHKDDPRNSYTGLSQFNGETVGYVRGYWYVDEFNNYLDFTKMASTSDLQALKMLDSKRMDVFLGDAVNNFTLVEEENLDLKQLTPSVSMSYLSLIFQGTLSDEFTRFEQALNEMYSDGTVDRIYRKYLNLGYDDFLNKYK